MLNPARRVSNQRHQKQHDKYEKQDLRDSRRSDRDSTESENRGHDRYQQKHQRVIQHALSPLPSGPSSLDGRETVLPLGVQVGCHFAGRDIAATSAMAAADCPEEIASFAALLRSAYSKVPVQVPLGTRLLALLHRGQISSDNAP
jgi:hypothetical protein